MGVSDAVALGLFYAIIVGFGLVMLLLARASEKRETRGQK